MGRGRLDPQDRLDSTSLVTAEAAFESWSTLGQAVIERAGAVVGTGFTRVGSR